jgi:hypothetical protein
MQDAHNNYDITDFHGALLDIISVMNQPVRDEQLLQAADVQIDQILFPLLVAIGRYGPVGSWSWRIAWGAITPPSVGR